MCDNCCQTEGPIDDAIAEESNESSHELFEQLRTKRAELAKEENVLSFVIFSDKTLQDMATRFPQTVDSFRQTFGVGPVKVKKYADVLLPIICAYCQAHGLMDQNLSREEKEEGNRIRILAGSRTYFFNIQLSQNGEKYLVISESEQVDTSSPK